MDLFRDEYFVHLHNKKNNGVLENVFPLPLFFEGNWEVALIELSVSKDFDNVSSGSDFLMIMYDDEMLARAVVPAGMYTRFSDYTKHLQSKFGEDIKKVVKLKTEGNSATFKFLSDRVTLKFSEGAADHLQLTDGETRSEGIKPERLEEDEYEDIQVTFDPWVNMRRIFLTTPYISPHFFNGSAKPVLASCMLNEQDLTSKLVYANFAPTYFPLLVNILEKFDIQLMDEKGRILDGDHQHMYALVHIRKKFDA